MLLAQALPAACRAAAGGLAAQRARHERTPLATRAFAAAAATTAPAVAVVRAPTVARTPAPAALAAGAAARQPRLALGAARRRPRQPLPPRGPHLARIAATTAKAAQTLSL
jgi:hypothetical protein